MKRSCLAVVVVAAALVVASRSEAAIPSWERNALVTLHQSANGPAWFGGESWPIGAAGTECSWRGVTCNQAGTAVVELDLAGAGLWGVLPDELSQLGSLRTLLLWQNTLYGPIPPELDRLGNLVHLDLSYNYLSGPIPEGFSRLTRLEQLWLEDNELSGPIPAALGNLQSLQILSLSVNQFTGGIPPALWNARNLAYLDLQYNGLTGQIPPGIANLGQLYTLDLSENDLVGAIPWSELSPTLNYLSLGSNRFSTDGILPADIGRLQSLSYLLLKNLGLWSIPAEIGLLEDLLWLDLSENLLDLVPAEIGLLQDLEWLDLSDNYFLELPVVITSLPSLSTLRFGWNIIDTVPSETGMMASLQSLHLDGNFFLTVPAELRHLPSLVTLDMSWNYLESATFSSGFSNLSEIFLGYNFLTEFPDAALPQLRVLDLTANYITGPLPAWLTTMRSLEELSLWQNEFEGPIPHQLGSLQALTFLDLGWNRFSGPVPAWLNQLSNLETLYLDFNDLEGAVPGLPALQKLTLLGLNDNELSGAVPGHLSTLRSLRTLLLYGNRLEGPLPRELAYTNLTTLDLSGNFLTGAVPPEYGSSPIVYLYLEKNNLRGAVPETFIDREFLYTNLEHNALTASPHVAESLQEWTYFLETQTVPPGGVTVRSVSAYAAELGWNPIPYRSGGGGYQIQLSTTPGGPYTPVLTTNDKGEAGAILTGLSPSTRYYGVVKTVSYPFSEGTLQQLNRIFSDGSPQFVFTTGAAASVPAQVAVTSRPRGMVQAPGVAGGTDSYTLTNIGGMATTVTVSTSDTFFTQSPAVLNLQPGQSGVVALHGVAVPEGSYRGSARISGAGVPSGHTVSVSLLSLEPPDEEPVVRAVSSRIDLSAPAEENPVATVVYENVGNVTFSGILVSDVEFLVPPLGLIEIEPNERVTVNVVSDRSKRPDAALLAGTAVGKVFLLSLGEKNPFGKGPVTASETASTTLVTVVDNVKPKTEVAELSALAPDEIAWIVPHVGHVTGRNGLYISDVTILNASSSKLSSPQLFYRPFDPNAGPTVAATLPALSSRQLVSYGDVVTSVFSQTNVGTLVLRGASEQTSIVASIFNTSDPRGLYGTTIPAFRSDRAISGSEEIVMTGLKVTATQYTNVFLQEARGGTAVADVSFFDRHGKEIGSRVVGIGPFSMARLGGDEIPQGTVAARIKNDGSGGLVAYATPVDPSLDSWTVADWSQIYGSDPGGTVVIPVGGAAAGANNTDFRTDVTITNRCLEVLDPREEGNEGTPCTAKVAQVVVRYKVGGQVLERTIELGLGETVELDDIVRGLFGVQGDTVGYFEIQPRFGSLAVSSRTYDLATDGRTFGSSVPALGNLSAIRLGQSRVLTGLEDAKLSTQQAGTGGTRRTNFGMVEVGGAPIRVKVTVSFSVAYSQLAKTSVQHSKVFDLPAGGMVRASRIVASIMGQQRDEALQDLTDVTAEFTVIDGDGALMLYTSSVDNGTADSVIRVE